VEGRIKIIWAGEKYLFCTKHPPKSGWSKKKRTPIHANNPSKKDQKRRRKRKDNLLLGKKDKEEDFSGLLQKRSPLSEPHPPKKYN